MWNFLWPTKQERYVCVRIFIQSGVIQKCSHIHRAFQQSYKSWYRKYQAVALSISRISRGLRFQRFIFRTLSIYRSFCWDGKTSAGHFNHESAPTVFHVYLGMANHGIFFIVFLFEISERWTVKTWLSF